MDIQGFNGSGTMTGSETGPSSGVYYITGITGTVNGSTITGIMPVDSFYSNDNDLYFPAVDMAGQVNAEPVQLDPDGLAFYVPGQCDNSGSNDGGECLIYAATGDYIPANGLYEVFPFGSGQFSAVLATTPLPAALPLLATGLGGLGLLGWRRKRKAQAGA